MKLRLSWLVAAFFLILPNMSFAADLTVEVLGLRSNEGHVHFGLYDNPETFPTKDGRLAGMHTAIMNNSAVAVFKGLKPGRYALRVFHDENANGEFDQIFFRPAGGGFRLFQRRRGLFRPARIRRCRCFRSCRRGEDHHSNRLNTVFWSLRKGECPKTGNYLLRFIHQTLVCVTETGYHI